MRRSVVVALMAAVWVSSAYGIGGDMGVGTEPLTDGSEAHPWLIEDFADFQAFCGDTTKWASGVHTRLEADLDLSAAGTYSQAPIAGDIDTDSTFDGIAYTGHFDGNGHVISNLTIDGANYCGLFGKTAAGAEIKNLGLNNASITCSRNYAAALVGYNDCGIIDCYTKGDIAGYMNVGGLVGINYSSGDIINSYTTAVVIGNSYYTGGLVGSNVDGNISACYTTGSVTGNNDVGGLIGSNSGPITGCYATGTVTGSHDTGGLVGANTDTITDCYAIGRVTGGDRVGGLVGLHFSGTMITCFATGSVSGTSVIGGLVGDNWDVLISCHAAGTVEAISTYYSSSGGGLAGSNSGEIIFCYATGAVTAAATPLTGYAYAGGLVGYNTSIITNCYAIGPVASPTNDSRVGGLVGRDYNGVITSCYTAGTVTTRSHGGGLCGENGGMVTSCYATGAVIGTGYAYKGLGGLLGRSYNNGVTVCCYATGSVSAAGYSHDARIGGLVGYMESGAVTKCFWDTQSSGRAGSCRGKGVTSAQMQSVAVLQNAGWGASDWVMADGADYPRLVWEATGYAAIPPASPVPLAGSGTSEDPYQVQTAADFALLSWYEDILDKHLCLTNDIDLAGESLYPIGDLAPFTGCFDGGGHVVRHASMERTESDQIGVFGRLGSGGRIVDLGVEDVQISGYSVVGGLVSYGYGGEITSCYVTGDVAAVAVNHVSNVGGLMGYQETGAITNCTVEGNVDGASVVGGLVGWNDSGTVVSCHTNTPFAGMANNVGGLIGYSENGEIADCYAVGEIYSSSSVSCSRVGGLVGQSYADVVTDCYATGSVYGLSYVGGLMGEAEYGDIIGCYATGSVTSFSNTYFYRAYAGGLVGHNDTGTITDSYATGAVNGNEFYVGGLAGNNYKGMILRCFAAGDVNGLSYVGGLVGRNYNNGSIDFCYATGEVNGTGDNLGGLVGYNFNVITSCYAAGRVYGSGNTIGGLVGNTNSSAISSSFWDMDTTGQATSAGGEGKTTAQMYTKTTFTDAGWDFVGEAVNGNEDIWYINPQEYPRLSYFPSLKIEEWMFVSQRRVSRTVYEYVYQLTVRNDGGQDFYDVELAPVKYPSNWTIVDGSVNVGDIAVGVVVTTADTVCFQVDRSEPSDCDELFWHISYGEAPDGMGMMATSRLPWPQEDSLSGDLSGDGSVNLVDLVMLMQEWLATGVNAADIAPGNGDGVVNLEDFSELVSQMEGN